MVGHLRRGIELDGSPKFASIDLAYKSETDRYIYNRRRDRKFIQKDLVIGYHVHRWTLIHEIEIPSQGAVDGFVDTVNDTRRGLRT